MENTTTEKGEIKIKENENYNIEITDLGDENDGITTINGLKVIIPKTEIGKRYEIKITHIRKKPYTNKAFAFGKKIRELKKEEVLEND